MSQVLTISETLYTQLKTTAQRYGLLSIEQLLEVWQSQENDLRQRQEIGQRTNVLRERLLASYGEMPNRATFEGVVDKGQIRLKSKVLLPDQAKVYVIIPDLEIQYVQLVSPRLVHREQVADFKKEVIEVVSDADV